MKDIETLILQGQGYNLSIAPEAETQKAELLKHSNLIVEVKDQDAAGAARIQLGKLSDMRILVEKSRTKVKAPVLAVGKDIDGKASEFVAAILAEENRLKSLIGEFAALVERERARIAREMEAKWQEEARLAREAEEARLKAEREAEEALRKAELDAMAAEAAMFNASTPEEEAQAAKLAKKAEELAAAQAAQRAAAVCDAAMVAPVAEAAPVFVPQKVAGTKFVADFDLLDVHQLYLARPSLVALCEKRKEILEYINANTVGDNLPDVPGLRVFLKAVVSGR